MRAEAQLVPNARWETIRTAHFRIIFTPELTEQARRAAVNAERAYAGLARELVAPRGTIDLVLADNADYVQGYATPFPSNRIVVYAHPASDETSLRNYSDWNELVVTHELTHIFHLDRVRGIWRFGQGIFGRNPLLFPNIYGPSWLTEGLAVYYESRLTGVGRLESGEHFMVARAAALAHEVPHLDELSRGTSRYPGGEVVYIYGSLLFDYLSRTRGPADVRKFVEKSSASLIPIWVNRNAKSAFGISFENAWKEWRDSLTAHLPNFPDPPEWRDLTRAGRTAFHPRWAGDSTIEYAGANGKEVPAFYSVALSGREENLGRRNGVDANARGNGIIFFTQPDLTTPYEERNDLWMQLGFRQTRLTHGARLHSIDARPDGEIVAIQNLPASTRLVRVSADGKKITTVAEGALDTQWADPRWSPDGARIAAVRLSRGVSEIVILDSTGKEITAFASSKRITATPAWSPDGQRIYFSSERTGSAQLYVAVLKGDAAEVHYITSVATGIFQPDVSPDGRFIAASLYRADGYHIGIFPVPDIASLPVVDPVTRGPRNSCGNCISRSREVTEPDPAALPPITPYSAFPSLLPKYWLPVFQSSADNGSGFGAETGGSDVIGRHSYDIEVLHNTTHGENSAWAYYRYAGLGMPIMGLSASQDYSREALYNFSGSKPRFVGDLVERSQLASVQAILVRPRVRTYSAIAIGAEFEKKRYVTEPDTLLRYVARIFQAPETYPSLFVSADWNNVQRPALSISPEDGFAFSTTLRDRWRTGGGQTSKSAVAAISGFKSLDFPGFAHHVFAVRTALGIADDRATSRFSAGGLSGSSVSIINGYDLGGQRRTFGVRGYPAGAEAGIRAVAGTMEYRAPLFAPSRGFRYLPLFIDKVSGVIFGEAGRAYCPSSALNGVGACLPSDVGNPWMSSVGAELNLDTGIQLDYAARVRIGIAIPTANRQELRAPSSLIYATFGTSF